MEENLFEWYENRASKLKVNPKKVVDHGRYVDPTYYDGDHIIFSGFAFYLKPPHSRDFKRKKQLIFPLTNMGNLSDEEIKSEMKVDRRLDNQLSAMSELIAEKKYRALKFITAKHFVLEDEKNYYLLSPNLLAGKLHNFSYYDLTVGNRIKQFERYAKSTSQDRLSSIVLNKEKYLEFMTEHCYNQYIQFILNGVFEFADDDGTQNIIFVKHKNSKVFEEVFVVDKESTVFNFMIASGYNFNQIKQMINSYSNYGGIVFNNRHEDNIEIKQNEIRRLFDRGIMGNTHLQILKQIAETDYDKLVEEALANTSLKKNQTQIDLYKYGTELAGDLAHQIEK